MKPKLKSRVTKISIGRLYNLGNYEHIRFEIDAEVPQGASPTATFMDLARIIARLRPVKKPWNYDEAVAALSKLEEQTTEQEKLRMSDYVELVKNYTAAKALRQAAVEALEAIGGTSKAQGARERWDWQDDPPG